MANKTTNYKLTKPLESEFYDVGVQNENMDKLNSLFAIQAPPCRFCWNVITSPPANYSGASSTLTLNAATTPTCRRTLAS